MSRGGNIARATALAACFSAWLFACNAILGNESQYRLVLAKDAGASCTLNSDCTGGKVCIFESCSVPCHTDVDCDTGSRCLETQTKAGTACVSPTQAKCTGGNCPEGTACSDGTCRTVCGEAGGCRTDQTCTVGVCVGTNSSHDTPTGGGGSSGESGGSGASSGTGASGGSSGTGGSGGATGSGGSAAEGGADASSGGATDSGLDAASGTGGAVVDPCVGVVCNRPPAASCSDGGMLHTYAAVGSCAAGKCSYQETENPCQFGCGTDKCNPDPCASVTCNKPPANACQDTSHLTTYDTTGSCSGGTCSYASHDIACTCVNDACTTDPCALVVCNKPPSPSCSDPNTRATYAQNGTCSGGSCSYASTPTNCPFGCANGVCNPDPCLTTTCDSPPAASCPNDKQLTTYPATGTCSGGVCSYAPTTKTCTNQACVNGACSGVCAPGQLKCVSNSTESCSTTGSWSAPSACSNQACVSGKCVGSCTPNTTPSKCADTSTPEYCDTSGNYQVTAGCSGNTPLCLSGSCVGCLTSNDCTPTNECYTASCTSNTCGQSTKGEGSPCTAGVGWICNGAGKCSECTPNYANNCSSMEVCRSLACVSAVHTAGWETVSGTSNPTANFLYMMRMPALAHGAKLLAFGVSAAATGATYKLALYADIGNGTQPGTGAPLVATTSGITVVNGEAETTSFTPASVSLAASTTYWLAFKCNAQVNIHAASDASAVGLGATDSFINAFPSDPADTLSPILTQNGTDYGVYIRVQDTD